MPSVAPQVALSPPPGWEVDLEALRRAKKKRLQREERRDAAKIAREAAAAAPSPGPPGLPSPCPPGPGPGGAARTAAQTPAGPSPPRLFNPCVDPAPAALRTPLRDLPLGSPPPGAGAQLRE